VLWWYQNFVVVVVVGRAVIVVSISVGVVIEVACCDQE